MTDRIKELTNDAVNQVSGGDETEPTSDLKQFWEWLCDQFR